MAIKKFTPQNSDLFIGKDQGDHTLGKFGHLNYLLQQINAIDAEVPSQAGHAGEYLTTDGTNTSWAAVSTSRLSNTSIRNMTISSGGVVTNDLPIGAVNDGVLPNTKGGAMTTATISKVGNFDKLAVTGGNQGSYIYFNNLWLSDSALRIKLSVKVENLNKDGVTGTSYLGIVGYGNSFTWDTGTSINWGAVGELIGKGIGFYNYLVNYEGGDTSAVSSGTLAASGDILDIELQFFPVTGGSRFKITNRTSGQYTTAFKLSSGGNYGFSRTQITKTARLGLVASNADFTILDFKVYSGVDSPLASFIGDNYIVGYNQTFTETLLPKLSALAPYQFATYVANGANINNMFNVQVKEALKLKPKYIFLADLNLLDGRFINTSPDYTTWYAAFTNLINEIVAANSIPVLIKKPAGGIYASNTAAWNTFVDQQQIAFPQIKVLDMSALIWVWSDSFSLPGSSDFTQFANAVNNFLIAEGY